MKRKPYKHMRTEGKRVRLVADLREGGPSQDLLGDHAGIFCKVELDALNEPRQVGDHQDSLIIVLPDERQNLGVLWAEKLQRTPAEGSIPLADRDQPLDPPQE